ncbi:MAG TPA: O-methyltransferase [Caldilineaceae bacterium]|nr:O-methyltransferase [Caldilineaceae bacterium]
MAELIAPQVQSYLDQLVPARVAEMRKMESYAEEHNFPIIGPASGQLCYLVARLIGAQRVFELGSGYGYSTAWFARAVQENGGGVVHHVVWDETLSQMARGHLAAMGYDHLIRYHVGEAVQTLKETDGIFDLIFNDIDKEGYPASLPVIDEKLRPGGVLIIDNMFRGGQIFDKSDQSPSTQGVREVTRMLQDNDRWIISVAPIRDGVMIAMKK